MTTPQPPDVALRARRRPAALAGAGALLLAACGGGGGNVATPQPEPPPATLAAANLAVLIAEGDAVSEAIARAYQQARAIPEVNMIRLPVATSSDTISAADFVVLKAALDARLTPEVQATLVTWTRPSRVVGTCAMGLTSALALGYDRAHCGGCAATTRSSYYNSATRAPWTDLRLRPSMMLGAATLAQAQALIARGVAADGSMAGAAAPAAQGWFVRTSDATRSVRWPDMQQLAGVIAGGTALHYVDNASGNGNDALVGQDNVLFYLTGLSFVPQIASNRYLPGAVADTLTSLSGQLPDADGQLPATAWLVAGTTASYGTVEEPCNFSEKFPRATVLVARYQRGETLIEAYWKSVQWPGQGLFVGEPLARPWGTR